MTSDSCRNGTERCAEALRPARRRLRHRRQPAGRRAADAALVRRGADRRRCAPTRPPRSRPRCCAATAAALAGFLDDRRARPGRRHDGGLRPRRPGALLLQGGHPLHRPAATARRAESRSFTMSGSMPTALRRWPPIRDWPVGAARDLGGTGAAALSGERHARCSASRSRRAAGQFWELNNPERRAADRGDAARDGDRLSGESASPAAGSCRNPDYNRASSRSIVANRFNLQLSA